MTFSGDLSGISLADVFQNVAGNLATGWMTVEWRQRSCHIRFVSGEITGFSLEEGDRLVTPEFLVQRGYVAPEAMTKLLQKHRRSKKSLCQLAVAAKLLSDENVAHAVITRVEERLFDVLLLKEARFHFREGAPPVDLFDVDQKPGLVQLTIGPLLMEGARRRDEWTQIHRVVGTDRDLLILLEGYESVELEPLAAEIAPLLDGATDARTVLQQVAASRFDVMRAMAELVHLGVARLASADEIAGIAEDLRSNGGDLESAVLLMQRALEVERGNPELRRRLIDWFEEAGRTKEAAVELARLAHEAAQQGHITEALEGYKRAFDLDPEDLPLLERHLDLLKEHGEDVALVEGTHGLVAVYLEIGLADRARNTLRDTLESRRSIRTDEGLLSALAKVESSLGHWAESSRVYRQLAEATLGKDEKQGLEFLRSALEQTPDDDVLACRIRDIESGADQKRRSSRRRAASFAAGLAVMGTLLVAGVAEFRATRQVLDAFDGSLAMLGDGDVVESLVRLESVRQELVWSPTRERAGQLFERLADLQLRSVEEWVGRGEYARAGTILDALDTRIDRADLRAACDHLRQRIGAEENAFDVLQRVEALPLEAAADAADLDVLAGLTDSRYLDFLLAHLPRASRAEARIAMLRALSKIDSPRAVPMVARMFLTESDPTARTEMQVVLARVKESRTAGRRRADGTDWGLLRTELQAATRAGETRRAAEQLLQMLFPESLPR